MQSGPNSPRSHLLSETVVLCSEAPNSVANYETVKFFKMNTANQTVSKTPRK